MLHTTDVPEFENSTAAMFVGDTTILVVSNQNEDYTEKMQITNNRSQNQIKQKVY